MSTASRDQSTGPVADDSVHTSTELLSVVAARELAGRRVVFAGHGLPTLAVALAQQTVSPEVEIIYESGVTGAHPQELPRAVSDSVLVSGAASVIGMSALFNYMLQGNRVDVGFLGAAQVDRYGSLNSSIIGPDPKSPEARLPGSGGAAEIMANCGEAFLVMRRHTARTFVERLDYCTSPSPHRAAEHRVGAMPAGLGVTRVITDLGIMSREKPDDELCLTSIHPGVDVETVRKATGWDLRVSEQLAVTARPTPAELNILRGLDLDRVYLR